MGATAIAAMMAMAVLVQSPAAAAGLDEAAEGYKAYALGQIEASLAGAVALRDAIAANDLATAQAAWRAARGGWERSEVVAGEFFPELDDAIDAWPNAATGFHAIEAKLFGAHRTDALPLATALVDALSEFDRRVRAAPLSPQGLLNGTAKLVYEVGENKADGGESQFSGTSLDDMRDNAAGIEAAYRQVFAPTLAARDPGLAAAAERDIERLQKLVAAPDLKALEDGQLRRVTEDLALLLGLAGPELGLEKPKLED
jgi:iron uptake system component EfeO